jgi:hypothetical protein
MLNDDVVDLYGRTQIGTKVIVLPMNQRQIARVLQPSVVSGMTSTGSRRPGASSLY